MYARDAGERTLTLAVSGMLWHRSLVMIDSETKSLWSHLLGRAMRGPLKGTQLETLPATMTDWKTWRVLHPETTVAMLSKTSRNYRREVYRDPARFVTGMAIGEAARAWPFDQLIRQPLLNDEFRGTPLVVAFDRESGSTFMFDRRVDGQTLHFELRDGKVTDRETGSTWAPRLGRAKGGPLAGKQLAPLVGIISFRRTWEVFHPRSTYFRIE